MLAAQAISDATGAFTATPGIPRDQEFDVAITVAGYQVVTGKINTRGLGSASVMELEAIALKKQ